MGGAHNERKRISCLCDENSIELRSLQTTSEMAPLTPASTKLVRLCMNVRVIRPEMKIFEAHRQKMKRQFSTKTQRKLIVKDVREVKNLRSL